MFIIPPRLHLTTTNRSLKGHSSDNIHQRYQDVYQNMESNMESSVTDQHEVSCALGDGKVSVGERVGGSSGPSGMKCVKVV